MLASGSSLVATSAAISSDRYHLRLVGGDARDVCLLGQLCSPRSELRVGEREPITQVRVDA
jgi:hypothetical protein